MDRSLKQYWSSVNAKINRDEIFVGPVHEVDNPQSFPSVSSVINECASSTGILVTPGLEKAFDDAWFQALKDAFAAKSDDAKQQLDEYLETGLSNGRKLRLQIMLLPPGRYFKIHAHTAIEFECTLKGSLHEFRWAFLVPPEKLIGENPTGPEIAATQLFEHLHVDEGECLVNEIGSVHQSFTTKDDGECVIVVLWSGCHANTDPSTVKNTDCRLRPDGA
jgi:hypothetical protein